MPKTIIKGCFFALVTCTLAAQTIDELEERLEQLKQDEHTSRARAAAAAARRAEIVGRNGGLEDLSGGVLRDIRTDLEWTQSDNGRDADYNDASNHCAVRGDGWRLPSVEELHAIFNAAMPGVQCGPITCKVSPFFRLTSYWFWTGTPGGESNAYFVGLDNGARIKGRMNVRHHGRALCVRPSPAR